MLKRLKIVIGTALLCCCATGSAIAELPLATSPVLYEVAPRERIWDGRIEAVNQATVSAQTSGRIAELPFDVNDFVDAGKIIVRFTDTEQRAALARAEADLQESNARLAQAEQEFTRFSSMIESGTISQSRFDESKANRDSTRARVNAARSGVATAKEQLEYTVVRAPYAGIVAERHVRLGEMVSPGQPLLTGLSLQTLRVNVDVPQSMFHAVRTIGKAFVYIDGQRIAAEELTFFPVADADANTFRVRVELPENSATVYPGMFVKVGFVTGETKRLLIPTTTVLRRSELSAVYVVTEDQVILRQIRLGRRYGEYTEVLAGLSEGEAVSVDPVSAGIFLKEQAGVR